MSFDTCSSDCEAHRYVMELINDLKENSIRRDEQYHDLKQNMAVLTHINNSVERTLQELKEYNKEQDRNTERNTKFVYKAGAIAGGLLFLASLTPLFQFINHVITATH